MLNMTPSAALAHFIMQPDMEDVRLTAYQDSAGIWTLGIGTTRIPDGQGGTRPVVQGDTCTLNQATQWLLDGMSVAAAETNKLLDGCSPTQNEFDAFTSFGYNVGIGAEATASSIGLYKSGDRVGAAQHLLLWDKARINGVLQPVEGLLKRRKCEAMMLLGQPWHIDVFADDSDPYTNTETLVRCMAAYA